MRGDLSDVWSYDAYYQYRPDQLRPDLPQRLLGRPPRPRARRGRQSEHARRRSGLPFGARRRRSELRPLGHLRARASVELRRRSPTSRRRGFTRGIDRADGGERLDHRQSRRVGRRSFPWAASGVGVALGVEYRKEALDFRSGHRVPDRRSRRPGRADAAGLRRIRRPRSVRRGPYPDRRGELHPRAALEAGYRYSDYGVGDRSFSTDTYKIAGFFAPIRDVRFRGGYNRAVRAPNIQELFAPQRVALDGIDRSVLGLRDRRRPTLGCLPGDGPVASAQYGASRRTRPASITA